MAKATQLSTETALAYEYFKIYRDTPPDERSLEKLCVHEVSGKKRTSTVFKRWSVDHNWQARVREWDIERSRESLGQFIKQRNRDLESFINNHFAFLQAMQAIAVKKARKLASEEDPNASEFRQTALGYQPVSQGLEKMIGIFDEEAVNISKEM